MASPASGRSCASPSLTSLKKGESCFLSFSHPARLLLHPRSFGRGRGRVPRWCWSQPGCLECCSWSRTGCRDRRQLLPCQGEETLAQDIEEACCRCSPARTSTSLYVFCISKNKRSWSGLSVILKIHVDQQKALPREKPKKSWLVESNWRHLGVAPRGINRTAPRVGWIWPAAIIIVIVIIASLKAQPENQVVLYSRFHLSISVVTICCVRGRLVWQFGECQWCLLIFRMIIIDHGD